MMEILYNNFEVCRALKNVILNSEGALSPKGIIILSSRCDMFFTFQKYSLQNFTHLKQSS